MIPTVSIILITVAILFAGCEDPVPTDYIPRYVFTGYLIVDEPVQAITLTTSLPPLDSFEYRNAAITDAQIRIWSSKDTFDLQYVPSDSGVGEYRVLDTTRLVEPGIEYFMEARLSDGTTLRSSTTTPERIEWVQAPREILQYPIDTVNLPSPDSLKLIWTRSPGVTEYLISIECLDTLNYGSYLEPVSKEKNRRIERFFEDDAPRYNEVVRWGFLQNREVNVVWFAFKWFGLHEITIYAPDPALLEWFKQVRFGGSQFETLLSNVEGGIGVFGSAAVARQNSFVLSNQP